MSETEMKQRYKSILYSYIAHMPSVEPITFSEDCYSGSANLWLIVRTSFSVGGEKPIRRTAWQDDDIYKRNHFHLCWHFWPGLQFQVRERVITSYYTFNNLGNRHSNFIAWKHRPIAWPRHTQISLFCTSCFYLFTPTFSRYLLLIQNRN